MVDGALIFLANFYYGPTALVGQGVLIDVVSRSHSGTPHSVGLLWMSDQPGARTKHTHTIHSKKTDIHAPGWIRNGNPSKPVHGHGPFTFIFVNIVGIPRM